MSPDKPRIAVYGVGKYGQYIIRFADRKGWPVVAAFNRAGSKVGEDIGQLAGLGKDSGVRVQDCDLANYRDLDADIAIVATTDRIAHNLPAYRRLLGAGTNVICHGGEAYYPQGADPAIAAEIERLALANGVTFTGTGIWDISRTWLPLVTAGNCTSIRALFHRSVTNSEGFDMATVVGTGTGMSVKEFEAKIGSVPGLYANLYGLVPAHVLTALGYHVTEWSERREPVLCDRPVYCKMLDRMLEPGIVIGTRTVCVATSREGVTATAHMEVRPLIHAGETEHMLWVIDGEPSSRTTIEREDSRHATASSMFNRIPDVIAAAPGIRLVSTLGPMRHTALD